MFTPSLKILGIFINVGFKRIYIFSLFSPPAIFKNQLLEIMDQPIMKDIAFYLTIERYVLSFG